jgi:hypothetical protein
MFFNLPSLILTVSLVLGAGAVRLESNTITSRPIIRLNPKCEQSDGSPFLYDARKAASQLIDFSADRCSGIFGIENNSKELCVTLNCFGSACISRCASEESTKSNQFACTMLAESIMEVIENPACWTKDQTKVGGVIRLEERSAKQWTDLIIHINPRLNILRAITKKRYT